MVDKVAMGQVFSDYFDFLCQFSFPQVPHTHHHLSSGAGTVGQKVADVPRPTSSQETNKKLIYLFWCAYCNLSISDYMTEILSQRLSGGILKTMRNLGKDV
jgi:hypothetical protein